MADGREWSSVNLGLQVTDSFCYGDSEPLCRAYGRLYTWEAAQRACLAQGDLWRLPTDLEWRTLAGHYGGVGDESADSGRTAFRELSAGGASGFNALLGGGRDGPSGGYARVDAHGFYWTATETAPGLAVFYNFGKGGQALHRQPEGEEDRAFSVRCIRGRT